MGAARPSGGSGSLLQLSFGGLHFLRQTGAFVVSEGERRPMETADWGPILGRHREWLASSGREGEPADLRGADLRGAVLDSADLRHALLAGADLEKARLADTDLSNADLTGANLSGTRLHQTNLRNARLTNADLETADLSTARNLRETQLGGCNLAFALLPSGLQIQGLELTREAARNYSVQLVSLLMACLYSWLTIGSTERRDLITNASATFFPFLEVSLPIVGFYFVAPLVLFALFLSFYLHLSTLWERLALLPAVFPDGLTLGQKADPPLVDALIERQMPQLAKMPRQSGPAGAKVVMAFLVVNLLVPGTLGLYWLTYLPRHEPFGTALHLVLVFAALAAARTFWLTLLRTFQGSEQGTRYWRPAPVALWLASLAACGVLSGCVLFGPRVAWGGLFYVDLDHQEVSLRGRAEDGPEAPPARRAMLVGSNLRFARLEGAYLAQAELDGSLLESAVLRLADLRQAQLNRADLRRADLWRARLDEAKLDQARLARAHLEEAVLQGASLARADLSGANLLRANLDGARLSRAVLDGAVLRGASCKGAEMELAQLNGAYLSQAVLTDARLFLTELRQAHLWKADLRNAHLVLADLSGAQLSAANLEKADLSQADLTGAALAETDLRGARLLFTRLDNALLAEADLRGAVLQGAQLKEADLRGARLDGAELRDAWLERTQLQGVDLSSTRGLTAEQLGLAIVDEQTVLPPSLRKAGR